MLMIGLLKINLLINWIKVKAKHEISVNFFALKLLPQTFQTLIFLFLIQISFSCQGVKNFRVSGGSGILLFFTKDIANDATLF